MLSILFSLSFLMVTLPFVPYFFTSLTIPSYSEELSVRQLFQFIQDELYRTESMTVSNDTLLLKNHNGEVVSIDQYQQVIRRQVTGKGHEILARDIEELEIQTNSFGFDITVKTIEGQLYEKKFSLY
ncbi:ComGF family competence protein [Aquibacillus albus]|uniref:ComGF family competence protein n=1 Tax=Aquibacillus albus TaxID=1168171 RepID=UPI001957793B|nr:ComGF family competence protein [Aquibacillus albus]